MVVTPPPPPGSFGLMAGGVSQTLTSSIGQLQTSLLPPEGQGGYNVAPSPPSVIDFFIKRAHLMICFLLILLILSSRQTYTVVNWVHIFAAVAILVVIAIILIIWWRVRKDEIGFVARQKAALTADRAEAEEAKQKDEYKKFGYYTQQLLGNPPQERQQIPRLYLNLGGNLGGNLGI